MPSRHQVLGDVVGLIIGSGLAVYDYVSGADDNYRNQNMQNQHEYARKYLRRRMLSWKLTEA